MWLPDTEQSRNEQPWDTSIGTLKRNNLLKDRFLFRKWKLLVGNQVYANEPVK